LFGRTLVDIFDNAENGIICQIHASYDSVLHNSTIDNHIDIDVEKYDTYIAYTCRLPIEPVLRTRL